jgi:isoamylase
MLLAGDEFGRSQGGNNNAYCQDNEISWLDWEGIDESHNTLVRFTQRLIAVRRALPMLRGGRFLTGQQDEELGVKDVTWITPSGDEMTPAHWADENARCMGILLDGRAQETGIRRVGTDPTLLLVTNAHHDVVKVTLPSAPRGEEWVCLIDTNQAELDSMPRFRFGHVYEVTARSLLLFMLRPELGIRSGGEADQSFDHVVDVLQRLTDGRKIQLFALSARSRGCRLS